MGPCWQSCSGGRRGTGRVASSWGRGKKGNPFWQCVGSVWISHSDLTGLWLLHGVVLVLPQPRMPIHASGGISDPVLNPFREVRQQKALSKLLLREVKAVPSSPGRVEKVPTKGSSRSGCPRDQSQGGAVLGRVWCPASFPVCAALGANPSVLPGTANGCWAPWETGTTLGALDKS